MKKVRFRANAQQRAAKRSGGEDNESRQEDASGGKLGQRKALGMFKLAFRPLLKSSADRL